MSYKQRPFGLLVGGTSLSTGRLSGFWPGKLQQALNGVCGRRVRVFDAGKGSQTSDWGVTQIAYWAGFRADAAVLEFSINDAAPALFASGLTGHQTNMNSIIDGLRATNSSIDITLQTMSPLGPNGATARPNLAGFYQSDRDIATAKSCRLLDNNVTWLSVRGASNQYCLPNDGTWTQNNDELHPTEARVEQILLANLISHFAPIINATVI